MSDIEAAAEPVSPAPQGDSQPMCARRGVHPSIEVPAPDEYLRPPISYRKAQQGAGRLELRNMDRESRLQGRNPYRSHEEG